MKPINKIERNLMAETEYEDYGDLVTKTPSPNWKKGLELTIQN